jgi:hypothetical protein
MSAAPAPRRTYGKRAKELSPPRPLLSAVDTEPSEASGEGAGDLKRSRIDSLLTSTLASQRVSVGRIRAQLEEMGYQLVRGGCARAW